MKLRILSLFLVIILISFSFSGCYKWAARAYVKLPDETALHKSYSYKGKVIIIGAGASGLAAAKVLEQNNINYQIIEATDRYGGRLKKDTGLADFPVDVGAEWIHSAPLALNKLKGKKGDKIDEALIPYHLEKAFNWNGIELKEIPQSQLDYLYNFMPESKFKTTSWYDFVDKNLAKEVKDKIKYNAPVTEINYEDKQVLIKTENGEEYRADKVLLTVSIGVLKSKKIKFTPELIQEKQMAIESITFSPGFKLIMKFNEKFYPDAINCEENSGEKVYYDIAFKKESEKNILGLLVTGKAADEYYRLSSEKEILDSVIAELDKMFKGKAGESFSGEYVLEDWGRHEFTKGTWTEAYKEKSSTLKTLNKSLDQKVYFAGEINDPYKQMGVPGAILSGYYMIDKLLTENDHQPK